MFFRLYLNYCVLTYLKITLSQVKIANLIISEMYESFHKFSVASENTTKSILWGDPEELVSIFFPKYGWVFFHQILIIWCNSSCGKCLAFPMNFSCHGKMQQSLFYGKSLGYWYLYFSQVMSPSVPLNSHSMVYYIIWMVY